MSSTAKFKITGSVSGASPFADGGFDCVAGEDLTIELEDLPALDVSRIQVSTVSLSDGAPAFTYSDGGAPSPPTTPVTTTAPSSGCHAFLVRVQVWGSYDARGQQLTDVRERVIVLRSDVTGLRKMAPAERAQYHATVAWTGAFGEIVDYLETGGAAGAWRVPVVAANTTALPAYTRTGNTLDADAVGAFPTLDGETLNVGDRFLYWTGLGTSHADYGVFVLDDAGSGSTTWSATRDPALDEDVEAVKALTVPVEGGGTTYGGHAFRLVTTGTITINTTALEFEDVGHLGALVTTSDSGVVNSLGAANTVLQSDGVGPGVQYNAELKLGSDPATGGSGVGINLSANSGIRVKTGANSRNLASYAGDSAYFGDSGAASPAYYDVGASTHVMRVATIPVLTVAAASVTLAASLVIDTGTYLASAGDLRLGDQFNVTARRADNALDFNVVRADGTNNLYFGTNTASSISGMYLQVPSTSSIVLQPGGAVLTVAASLITAAQPLALGGSFASTGDVRTETDFTLYGLDSGAGNARLIWWDGVSNDNVTFGEDTNVDDAYLAAASNVWLRVGGDNVFHVGAGSIDIGVGNFSFEADVSSPIIEHVADDTDGITAQAMLMHAQDVEGDSTPTGGKLTIRSGGDTGSSPSTNVSGGVVEIFPGLAKGGGTYNADMFIGRPETVPDLGHYAYGLYLNAQAAVRLQVQASTVIYVDSSQVNMNVALLNFSANRVNPTIYQLTESATDGQGDPLTDHAQDVSGAYSATNPRGGDRLIRSGGDDSASASNIDSGDAALFCGAVKGSGTRGDCYVGRDPSGTAANKAGWSYIDGTGGVDLQYDGTSRLKVDSTGIGFFATGPAAQQAITGALSSVSDANAKAVLTSFLNAFVAYGLVTDSTT